MDFPPKAFQCIGRHGDVVLNVEARHQLELDRGDTHFLEEPYLGQRARVLVGDLSDQFTAKNG